MAQSSSAKSGGTLSVRAGVSPKLLARKAAEKVSEGIPSEGVEVSFPVHAPELPQATQLVPGTSHGATAPAMATVPPLWVAPHLPPKSGLMRTRPAFRRCLQGVKQRA